LEKELRRFSGKSIPGRDAKIREMQIILASAASTFYTFKRFVFCLKKIF